MEPCVWHGLLSSFRQFTTTYCTTYMPCKLQDYRYRLADADADADSGECFEARPLLSSDGEQRIPVYVAKTAMPPTGT